MRDLDFKVKISKVAKIRNRSKSTLTFETFFIDTRLKISSENNDFGFHSIQKINFTKKSHLNALGSKFDLDVKKVNVILGSSFEQTW